MRTLRKAAVVAVMVGSVGMVGAGSAAAYGGGEMGSKGLLNFRLDNPQFINCAYTENVNTALTQAATTTVNGDATNTATLGNVCVQTGPSFSG